LGWPSAQVEKTNHGLTSHTASLVAGMTPRSWPRVIGYSTPSPLPPLGGASSGYPIAPPHDFFHAPNDAPDHHNDMSMVRDYLVRHECQHKAIAAFSEWIMICPMELVLYGWASFL